MNNKFTYLLSLLALLFFSAGASAQNNGDYQSAASGNWSSASSWQIFSGGSWQAATTYPIFAGAPAGYKITILNTHNITLDVNDTVNRVEVMNGGTLTISDGGSPINNLTINQDTLLIDAGGNLLLGGLDTVNSLSGTPAPEVQINGAFTWTSGELAVRTITAAGTTTTVKNGASSQNKQLMSTTFVNNGTINWSADATAGGIFLGNNSTFTNNPSGVINENFTGNRGFGGGTAGGTVVNNGIINKLSANELRFSNNFTNTGIIRGGTTGSVGTLGVTDVGGSVTSNTGTIAPGNGTTSGTLTVDPVLLTGTSATVAITIASTGDVAGTNYDQAIVSNSVNLNGTTLQVSDNGTDAVGTTYVVMTASAGAISGTPSTDFSPSIGNLTVTSTQVTVQKINTLPLTWGSFNALALSNGTVSLKWSTLQEENTSHFVVDYSSDGSTFNPIGTVAAAGNSGITTNYSFVDTHPSRNGTNFYRLQEVDLDGKVNYSGIRAVSFKNGQVVTVLASPNPAHDLLQLNVQGEGVRALFVDALGHTLHAWILQNGYQQVSIQDVPAGEYQLLIYQNNQKVDAQHIIKF